MELGGGGEFDLVRALARRWGALATGLGEAARVAGTRIVGGNLSAGPALTITTTVVGGAFAPVSRAGAQPGDTLWVTGILGGPAAAVRALSAGARASPELHARFVHPAARLREARWLAARGCVAAIDVSDGLVADAGHLAAASGVSLEIDADRIPVMRGATPDDALAGGEEYELLVAARGQLDVAAFSDAFGIPLTRVGTVVAKGSRPVVLTRGGVQISSPMGHDHFPR